VEKFWSEPKLFGIAEKSLAEGKRYAFLTNELKVEQVDLNKKPIRMVQWINMLLYISLPLLVCYKANIVFIKQWFLLVNFTAKLNQKRSPVGISELFALQKDIEIFVAFAEKLMGNRKFMTSKLHSLLHIISFVIRYGLLWNWGAKVFESHLHPVKKAVAKSKINAMVSLENAFLNWSTLSLFKGFSSELYQALGVCATRANYFEKILCDKEEEEKGRRDGNVNKEFVICGEQFFIKSCNKRIHEPTGEIITIDSYSCNLQTNNQFVIQRAIFVKDLEIDIPKITDNYCVCIESWGDVEVNYFSNIKEKVVCFELESFFYAIRIFR